MTVAPDTEQLQRWAAAHAATITAPALVTAHRGQVTRGRTGGRSPERPTGDNSSDDNSTVRLAALTPLREWDSGDTAVYAIAMGRRPDGRITVATGGDLHRGGPGPSPVRLWDAMTGQPLLTLNSDAAAVENIAWGYRDDGRAMLATAHFGGSARIWDPDTGESLHIIPGHGHPDQYSCIALRESSGAPPLLAVAGTDVDDDDGRVEIWDLEAAEIARTFSAGGLVYDLAWATHADGQEVLAVTIETSNGTATEIRDPDTGHRLEAFPADETIDAAAWHLCPDGRLLLATSFDDGARIRGISKGRTDGTEAICPGQTVRAVTWAPLGDGRALLASMDSEGLSLWDGRTCERLHAEPLGFRYSGARNLDWAVAPDGRLLLAAATEGGRIHVWEAVLDPPAGPPQAAQRRGRLMLPPREVTPEFPDARDINETTYRLDLVATTDGRTLVASAGDTRAAHLWDLTSGRHLRSVTGHGDGVSHASLAQDRNERLLLATSEGRTVRIWDADTGECLHTIPAVDRRVTFMTWTRTPDARLLLAISGGGTAQVWDADTGHWVVATEHGSMIQRTAWTPASDRAGLLATTDYQTTQIWDAGTGQRLHTLTGHDRAVFSLAWTQAPDGRFLLATADRSGAQIWDAGTGQCLHTLTRQGRYFTDVAWAHGPGGRLLLATADVSGAQIWDADTGQCLHTLAGHGGGVVHAAWAQASDGRLLLATTEGATAWIWDPVTGAEIASVTGSSDMLATMRWLRDGRGNLLLLAANREPRRGPVRAWLVEAAAEVAESSRSGRTGPHCLRQAAGHGGRLLRLGAGGLWPPLGLVADLVTLTGGDDVKPGAGAGRGEPASPALCDARLAAALASEAGISRLRDLAGGEPRWAPDARTAFAALLASALDIPDGYAPPPGASAAGLLGALNDALAGFRPLPAGAFDSPGGVASAWRAPVAGLLAAAAAVTDQVIALLAILGPDACAADPLLPVRLAHRVQELPALSSPELRLLAAMAGTGPADGTAAAAGTMIWGPGTVGVARTGPLSRLLPTELALPRDLLTMRLTENQLLYRQHRTRVPPAPQQVTIILDTTPPTFGPAGNTLRLAAHLITTTLWQWGLYPALVTLNDPGTSFEPRAPADLVRLWASATLSDPGACLAAARQTATRLGQPAVWCTHFQTARDEAYRSGPGSRLLTSHQPPEEPPAAPAGPWHVHLPPQPTPVQLTKAVGRLLTAPSGAT